MTVLRDGTFTHTIQSESLVRGLRPSKRVPRNSEYLIECSGAVGKDGVLQVIDNLNDDRVNTATITDGFPYPQLFMLTNVTIICGETDIYEYNGTLTHMIGPVAAGQKWTVLDFYEYIFLSNGVVNVIRDSSGTYALDTDHPLATAACNYNGQAIIGVPLGAI